MLRSDCSIIWITDVSESCPIKMGERENEFGGFVFVLIRHVTQDLGKAPDI
jgi:hypothetical protein